MGALGILAWSCQRQKTVCPAYQSAFYLDQKKAVQKFYTRRGTDSMPLVDRKRLKDEHLVAAYVSRAKKSQQIATIGQTTEFFPMQYSDSVKLGFIVDSTSIREKIKLKQEYEKLLQEERELEQKANEGLDTTENFEDAFIQDNPPVVEQLKEPQIPSVPNPSNGYTKPTPPDLVKPKATKKATKTIQSKKPAKAIVQE